MAAAPPRVGLAHEEELVEVRDASPAVEPAAAGPASDTAPRAAWSDGVSRAAGAVQVAESSGNAPVPPIAAKAFRPTAAAVALYMTVCCLAAACWLAAQAVYVDPLWAKTAEGNPSSGAAAAPLHVSLVFITLALCALFDDVVSGVAVATFGRAQPPAAAATRGTPSDVEHLLPSKAPEGSAGSESIVTSLAGGSTVATASGTGKPGPPSSSGGPPVEGTAAAAVYAAPDVAVDSGSSSSTESSRNTERGKHWGVANVAAAVRLVVLVAFVIAEALVAPPPAVSGVASQPPLLPNNCSIVADMEGAQDLAGMCSASRIGRPEAGTAEVTLGSVAAMGSTGPLIRRFVGNQVSDEEVEECTRDGLGPLVCASLVPTCTIDCSVGLRPCRSMCAVAETKCGFVLDVVRGTQALWTTNAAFLNSLVPEPKELNSVVMKNALEGLLACESDFWADGPLCTGADHVPEQRGDSSVADDTCDYDAHVRRVAAYDAAVAGLGDTTTEQAWRLHRVLISGVCALLLMMVPLAASWTGTPNVGDHRGATSIHEPNALELGHHKPASGRITPSRTPAAATHMGTNTDATGASDTTPQLDEPSGPIKASIRKPRRRRRGSYESEMSTAATHSVDVKFTAVVGWQMWVMCALLVLCGCVVIRVAVDTAVQHQVGESIWFLLLSQVPFRVAVSLLGRWHGTYVEGVHRFMFGVRDLELRQSAGLLQVLRHYVALAFQWHRRYTGIDGVYFALRIVLLESVEVVTQVASTLDRIAQVSSTVLLATLWIVAINVAVALGIGVVAENENARAFSVLWELVCDSLYFFLAGVIIYDITGLHGAAQIIGFSLPLLLMAWTLRELGRRHMFVAAHRDCAVAGVHQADRISSFESKRLAHGLPVRSGGVRGASSRLRRLATRGAESTCLRRSRVAAAVGTGVTVVALATWLTVRVAIADADCTAANGGLWQGVQSSEKLFLVDGVWQPARCNYESITRLDLRGAGLTQLDDSLGNFVAVTSIDARDNPDLSRISPRVAALDDLDTLLLADAAPVRTSLSWRGANLTAVPPQIELLSDLERLDLSQNSLSDLGAALTLTALTSLNVSHNEIEELEPGVDGLASLDVLDASSNPLRTLMSIPEAVARVGHLDVHDCDIADNQLPSTMAPVDYRFIDLSGNRVTSLAWTSLFLDALPGWVFDQLCPNQLVYFDASSNTITSLSPTIGQCTSLETLVLADNALRDLPDELFSLPKLKNLHLSTNVGLAGPLDPRFMNLPALEQLLMWCTDVTSFAPDFYRMEHLSVLALDMNPLTAIPAVPDGVTPTLKILSLEGIQGMMLEGLQPLLEAPLNATDMWLRTRYTFWDDAAAAARAAIEGNTTLTCSVASREAHLDAAVGETTLDMCEGATNGRGLEHPNFAAQPLADAFLTYCPSRPEFYDASASA